MLKTFKSIVRVNVFSVTFHGVVFACESGKSVADLDLVEILDLWICEAVQIEFDCPVRLGLCFELQSQFRA